MNEKTNRIEDSTSSEESGSKYNLRDVERLQRRGEMLRSSGLFGDARKIFVDILNQYPDNTNARISLAKIFLDLGQNKQALDSINKIDNLSSNALALVIKGKIQLDSGDLDESIGSLNRAIELEPTLLEGHLSLIDVLLDLNRQSEAEEALKRAQNNPNLNKNYDKSLVLGYEGLMLAYSGKYYEAQRAFELSLDLEHKNTFARWGLGECLRLKGKYEEALQVFDLAASMISVEVIPRRLSTKIFRSRGQTFSRLGRPDEAISAFKNALDLAPPGSTDRVDLIIDLSLASRDREDYIEALSYLREIDPEIIRAQSAKGIIYSDIAEYELSIAILDEVLKRAAMGPSDIKNAQRSINRNTLAKVYHYKGWSLIHLNKAEEAHKVYEEAIRLNTEDLLAHKGIANALRLQNNIIDAENKYRYVVNQVKMKPLNSHLLSILGWCHYCLGEYDKAIRCFNDVYSLNPEWIGNRFDLALALLCSGRYTLGIQEYSMSIKLTESKQVPNQHGLLCLAYYDFKDARDNFKRLDRAIEERNKANDLLNNALKQIIGPYEEIKRSLICP